MATLVATCISGGSDSCYLWQNFDGWAIGALVQTAPEDPTNFYGFCIPAIGACAASYGGENADFNYGSYYQTTFNKTVPDTSFVKTGNAHNCVDTLFGTTPGGFCYGGAYGGNANATLWWHFQDGKTNGGTRNFEVDDYLDVWFVTSAHGNAQTPALKLAGGIATAISSIGLAIAATCALI